MTTAHTEAPPSAGRAGLFLARFQHVFHKYFLAFLVGSYFVAAVLPGPGLWIRGVSFGTVKVVGEPTHVTLPMMMLGLLLFNAGLGARVEELKGIARRPAALLAGLAGNLLIPIVFIFAVSNVLRFWHNPEELQTILVGLALVAAMPIAGSSTAWSQNANGNVALSLGLVVASTLLSPLTTPIALHSVGFMAKGDYAEDLHELATSGTGGFLAVSVVAPSLLGLLARFTLGEKRLARAKGTIKLINAANLLLLNYSNAAIALPQAIKEPDYDFLIAILVIVAALCALGFGSGALIARLLGAGDATRSSLMYGLGMNNNGTGLVLASLTLADHPQVMLPIIGYNLVQQVVAGGVGFFLFREEPPEPEAVPSAELASGGRQPPVGSGGRIEPTGG